MFYKNEFFKSQNMEELPGELIEYIMKLSYPLAALRLKYTCKHLSNFTPKYYGDPHVIGDVFELDRDIINGNDYCKLAEHGHIELVVGVPLSDPIMCGACRGGHIDIINMFYSKFDSRYEDLAVSACCSGGHVNALKRLLELGADKNHLNLENACSSNNVEMVEYVLSIGKFNGKSIDKGFKRACRCGNIEIIKLLASLGCENFNNGLKVASYSGNIEAVKLLLSYGANNIDEAFIAACEGNYLEVARLLVTGIKDQDSINKGMSVCKYKNIELVGFLLEHGANNFNSFMEGAAIRGSFEIVKMMIEHGANKFNRCMEYATNIGSIEIVKLMIELGANDFDKCIATAIFFDRIEIFAFMLDYVSNYNELLVYACNHSNEQIVRILIDRGANNFDECIKIACEYSSPDVFKVLLEYCNPDIEECFALACKSVYRYNYPDIIDMLLGMGAKNFNEALKSCVYPPSIHVIRLVKLGANNLSECLEIACSRGNFRTVVELIQLGAKDDIAVCRCGHKRPANLMS
jgi:ankyrin repeat protein